MFRADRLPYLGAAILAAIFMSQAFRLEYFSPFGPGPGIFPQFATIAALGLAVVLYLVPALSFEQRAPSQEEEIQPEELRTFRLYLAALVLLVIGSAFLGFLLTCVLTALLLTWFAERKPWWHALIFGLACGIAGIAGLSHYLQIEIPMSDLDTILLRPIR